MESWRTLLPFTAQVNHVHHLELGGCDVTDLAREFGTPLYVFDEITLREQAARVQEAFRAHWPETMVLYATKAYFAPFLARIFCELGLGLDVSSEAEMVIARRVGFEPARLYVHGNNKTAAEIRTALEMGITHFVIDNLQEISRLSLLAASILPPSAVVQLLIRLAPNIDAHTHHYLTTGLAHSKFGLGIHNGAAERAMREIARCANLELVGLHVHIGSQVFAADAFGDALNVALDVAADWQRRLGFHLAELDLGGGWGVAYDEAQTSLDIEAFAANITRALRMGLEKHGLEKDVRLLVEPGRALVARAAVALYRVGAIKEIPVETPHGAARTYVAVDGGMGDNIRPALYGARYGAFLANRFAQEATHEYAIVGRYCEQGDVLIATVRLPKVRVDDLVVVPMAGAYQLPMASNYNLVPRPAVVLVRDGRARLVRRRETIQDLLACDLDP